MKKKKAFSATGCFLKLIAGTVFVLTLIGLTCWMITSDKVIAVIPQSWQLPGLVCLLVAVFVMGVELATVILSPRSSTPFGILGLKRKDYTIEALNAQGLLVQQTFHARRAFAVEEWEDEGIQYFVELADQSVLFLQGQYLYDFEPITDDPELNQPRSFPCTEFVISRDQNDDYFFQLDCKGPAFEPECTAPAFSRKDCRQGRVPDNGEIISGISYDELKRQRLASAD